MAPICIRFLKFMEDGGQVFFLAQTKRVMGREMEFFKSSDKGLEENPYKNY